MTNEKNSVAVMYPLVEQVTSALDDNELNSFFLAAKSGFDLASRPWYKKIEALHITYYGLHELELKVLEHVWVKRIKNKYLTYKGKNEIMGVKS